MKLEITFRHFEPTDDLKKYANKKMQKLSRYLPKHARKTAHAIVVLEDDPGAKPNSYSCEVTLHIPHEEIIAKEATVNMFAAIDIVEAKVRNQLLKYKGKTTNHKADKRRVLSKFRRLADTFNTEQE